MQQITPEFIKSCLLTQEDYKNARPIKLAVQDNQEHVFETICNTIKEVLTWDTNRNLYPPLTKLLALRLSKELIEISNMRFINQYEAIALNSLKYYAEFGDPANDQNRGSNLFGDKMEKETRQYGTSLVRLAMECIKAWALFFPQYPQGGPTKFIQLYLDLENKGYTINTWSYFKQEFVNQHTSPEYPHTVDLLQFLQTECTHKQHNYLFIDTILLM